MMGLAEVLTQARALVAKGWCQNSLRDEDRFCALGALYEAASGGIENLGDAEDALDNLGDAEDALRNALEPAYQSVVHFNDDQLTTQADVLRLYDRAIALIGGAAYQ